jgi:hypothetical protein
LSLHPLPTLDKTAVNISIYSETTDVSIPFSQKIEDFCKHGAWKTKTPLNSKNAESRDFNTAKSNGKKDVIGNWFSSNLNSFCHTLTNA